MNTVDVAIIGAGAAGLICAGEVAKRGRSVLVVEHTSRPGEKIRISGGGRCNFTNTGASAKNFLSENPRFAISALSRYTAQDFVALVERYGIAYHEKILGQLFCDGPATQITDMLLGEMRQGAADLRLGTAVEGVKRAGDGFQLRLDGETIQCRSLVVATGGKSIPKIGATGWGYRVAEQFGLRVTETRPALVPLTIEQGLLEEIKPLAGIAVEARVRCGKTGFDEALLFTHRGLSGPAVIQISTYWREGDEIAVDLLPGADMFAALREAKQAQGRQDVQTVLGSMLPKRLAQALCEWSGVAGRIGDLPDARLQKLTDQVNAWRVKPVGSEGYRTAEVTLGGVDTAALDARTMECKTVPGLYFIGEVVDVTGWLGGYNFQWAWSSGWAAGQVA